MPPCHTQEAECKVFLIVKFNSWRHLKIPKEAKQTSTASQNVLCLGFFSFNVSICCRTPVSIVVVAPVFYGRQDLINTLTIIALPPPCKGQRSASIERSGTVVVCCLWGWKITAQRRFVFLTKTYKISLMTENEPCLSVLWTYLRKVSFSISKIRRICCSFPLLCVESSAVCVTLRNVMNYLINQWCWFGWKLQTSMFRLKCNTCWLWVRGKRTGLWDKMDAFWIVIP